MTTTIAENVLPYDRSSLKLFMGREIRFHGLWKQEKKKKKVFCIVVPNPGLEVHGEKNISKLHLLVIHVKRCDI